MKIILRLVKKIAVAKYRVFLSFMLALFEKKNLDFFSGKLTENHEVNPLVQDPGVEMEVVTGRAESI